MKKIILLCVFCFSLATSIAQKETFDLTTFTPPTARKSDGQRWKKEVKANSYTSYSITNTQTRSYCQIFIMLSTNSKGGIKEDFENEWQNLIVKQYNVTDTAHTTEPLTAGSWQMKAGIAPFIFNNGTSTAMLTTMSGYNKAVSIVAVSNSEEYISAIQQLLKSVVMKKPSSDNPV